MTDRIDPADAIALQAEADRQMQERHYEDMAARHAEADRQHYERMERQHRDFMDRLDRIAAAIERLGSS